MKKLFFLLSALFLAISPLWAYDFVIDGICYTVTNKTNREVEVASPDNYYVRYSGDMVIPSNVSTGTKTYSVTAIGYQAFKDCKEVSSITIPNSVTKIGANAFWRCWGLTSMTIPNSVTVIEEYAFWSCSSLTELTIGEGVTTIENEAFYGCTGLKELIIPNSVTTIGTNAFNSCTGLTELTIGNGLTTIGGFGGCTGLTSLIIPDNITTIGSFGGCTGLTELIIGNGVTTIESSAFNRCVGLTSVTIPNNVTTIGSSAFKGCTGLTEITIPNSVTSIDFDAFYECEGLTSIYCGIYTPYGVIDPFSASTYKNAILYVPTGRKAIYEATYPWQRFEDIRESDFSGMEETLLEGVTITAQDGSIVINGIDQPVTIEVYSLNGQLLYSGSDTTIPVSERGTYLVRVDNDVMKVVL